MKRLLFIDPASISSGWALFEGGKLRSSGTASVPQAWPIFDRLRALARTYQTLFAEHQLDEVHIEQLVRMTHVFTHWSVGVIGAALAPMAGSVAADVAISSWQKAVGWKRSKSKKRTVILEANSPLQGRKTTSEDELAAIGMGIYWSSKEPKCKS